MSRAIKDVMSEQRPDWPEYFLRIAEVVATRATCDRKKVGAVLVDDTMRIVSTGYNGAPAGLPHCDEVGHELVEIDGRQSCVRTLHAESNAVDRAGRAAEDGGLFVTVIPCYDCAKRIVNAGIVSVYYREYYESRNTSRVADYLEDAHVDLIHVPREENENEDVLG